MSLLAAITAIIRFLLLLLPYPAAPADDQHLGHVYQTSQFERLHREITSFHAVEAFKMIEDEFHRNVNIQNASGWAPLHVAAQAGSEVFAALIIDNKADVRVKTVDGLQPLHVALINNRLSFIQLLLRGDPTLAEERCCGPSNKTISHLAAEYNIVELLYIMSNLFDASAIDGYGQTPICWAARKASTDFARKFFEEPRYIKGFEIDESICVYTNGSDMVQAPLMHIAAYYGQIAFSKFLLARFANVSSRDTIGGTPIHAIAMRNDSDPQVGFKIASELQEFGADVEAKDFAGRTPYLVAIMSSSIDFARVLVDTFKANTSAVDLLGFSAFHLADKTDVIDFLTTSVDVEKVTAEINTPTRPASCIDAVTDNDNKNGEIECPLKASGMTPLLLAVKLRRNMKFIKFLVDNHADVMATNDYGQGVLHIAVEVNYFAALIYFVTEFIMPHTSDKLDRTPLFYAVQLNRTEAVHIFAVTLRESSEVLDQQAEKFKRYTPLHMAVEVGNSKMIEDLIRRGTNLTLLATNGRNPLHLAISNHNLRIAARLIALADPEAVQATDGLDRSPLHLSVSTLSADYAISKMLLQKTTQNIDNVDALGDTPLQRAIFHESIDVVRLLLENGASCFVKDQQGRSPVKLAKQINNDDLLQVILLFCKDEKFTPNDCLPGSPCATALETAKKTCSSVPAIVNGIIENHPLADGFTTNFTCKPGYVVEGTDIITCLIEGRWAVGGFCRKACKDQYDIGNGVIDAAEDGYGLTGMLRCAAGFRLYGSPLAYCNGNGDWEVTGRCEITIPSFYTPDYFKAWNQSLERPPVFAASAAITAILSLQDDNHPYEYPSVIVISHQGHLVALSRTNWSSVDWEATLTLGNIYLNHAVYDWKEDAIYFSNFDEKAGQIYYTTRWLLMRASNSFGSMVPLQVLIGKEQSAGRKFHGLYLDGDARLLYACDYDGQVGDISVWLLLPALAATDSEVALRQAKLVASLKLSYPPMFAAFHVVARAKAPTLLTRTVNSSGDIFMLAISDHNGNHIDLYTAVYKDFKKLISEMSSKRAGSVTLNQLQQRTSNVLKNFGPINRQDTINPRRLGSVYCPSELLFDCLGNLFVADNCNHRVQVFQLDKVENIWSPMTAVWALNATGTNIYRLALERNPETGKVVLLANYAGKNLIYVD